MLVSRNLTGLRLSLSICFKTSPVLSAMLLDLLQDFKGCALCLDQCSLQPNNLQLANSLKRLAVQH
jgi:hypothetical protein